LVVAGIPGFLNSGSGSGTGFFEKGDGVPDPFFSGLWIARSTERSGRPAVATSVSLDR